MKTILLVEDDESLGESLTARLIEEPYQVLWARNLSDARNLLAKEHIDVAVLDVGLPDGTGFSLAHEIKGGSLKTLPIIFLTAMNSAEYRLEGFELGADDYIPKPFHLKELLLRIRKVIDGRTVQRVKKAGPFTLYEDGYRVEMTSGESVILAKRDFDLLCFLIEESPRAVERSEILQRIFNSDPSITPRTVDNSIVKIRTALGVLGEGHLRSVRAVGYQWIS